MAPNRNKTSESGNRENSRLFLALIFALTIVSGGFAEAQEPASAPTLSSSSRGHSGFSCWYCIQVTCRVGEEKRRERICDGGIVSNYLECDRSYCTILADAQKQVKEGNASYQEAGLDIVCSVDRIETYWGTFWWQQFEELYC